MLQKKGSELGNTPLKLKLMAEKNSDVKPKHGTLNTAKIGLAKFLKSYASHITCADLATEEEENTKAAADELEKLNTVAESI